jgi:hypothetical protein
MGEQLTLRAGFVTWCNLIGQPDRAIARQTRHRAGASALQTVSDFGRV